MLGPPSPAGEKILGIPKRKRWLDSINHKAREKWIWHILVGLSPGILLKLFINKMHVLKIKEVIGEQPLSTVFRASSVLWYEETWEDSHGMWEVRFLGITVTLIPSWQQLRSRWNSDHHRPSTTICSVLFNSGWMYPKGSSIAGNFHARVP